MEALASMGWNPGSPTAELRASLLVHLRTELARVAATAAPSYVASYASSPSSLSSGPVQRARSAELALDPAKLADIGLAMGAAAVFNVNFELLPDGAKQVSAALSVACETLKARTAAGPAACGAEAAGDLARWIAWLEGDQVTVTV